MKLAGLMITIANIQHMSRMGGYLKDMSLQTGSFSTLKEELTSLPDFNIETFRNQDFHRYGNLGVYIPHDVRDYMLKGLGNPDEEGLIIKVYYGSEKNDGDHDELKYLIHGDKMNAHTRNTLIEKLNQGKRDSQDKRLGTIFV